MILKPLDVCMRVCACVRVCTSTLRIREIYQLEDWMSVQRCSCQWYDLGESKNRGACFGPGRFWQVLEAETMSPLQNQRMVSQLRKLQSAVLFKSIS